MLLFDIAGPATIAARQLTSAEGVVLLIVIVLLEAFVLRAMKWGNFRRALIASVLMNGVTTLLGFVLLGLLDVTGIPFGLLLGWALSVGLEGGILLALNRGRARANWLGVLAANTASYILLAILLLPLF
jgi:hypothetical protein